MIAAQSAPRCRKGRGKSNDTIVLGQACHDILAGTPYAMTLRQLYYAAVSAGVIPKVEASYSRLKRIMRDRREDGLTPWGWLVDHTRSVFEPRTWDGIEGLLQDSARLYRRDLMRQQRVAIQVWAESDSIGSVITQVTDRYCIPTFIGRGYAARGYLWNAARDACAAHGTDKRVHILHIGDHDPSGVDIFRDVEETLRLYSTAINFEGWSVTETRRFLDRRIRADGVSPDDDVFGATEWQRELEFWTEWLEFERLALTADQIEEHQLPVRPLKASDARTAKFTGVGSVEVEALPVDVLLAIVEAAILARIDVRALEAAKLAEESERDIAKAIAAKPLERLVAA